MLPRHVVSGRAPPLAVGQAYNLQGPALLQTYLEAAQALGQALIAGNVETFKESMTASVTALGSAYLAEMLQKSKTIQRHLV